MSKPKVLVRKRRLIRQVTAQQVSMKIVKDVKKEGKYQNVNNDLQSYRPKKTVDGAIVKTNHCLQRSGIAEGGIFYNVQPGN